MHELPVRNPSLPFIGSIPKRFKDGKIIYIQGSLLPGSRHLDISLKNGPSPGDNIYLNIMILPSNKVIRNHMVHMHWGHEESEGNCPIKAGDDFQIVLLGKKKYMKIAINGKHFAKFNHRLPLHDVKYVSIEGEAVINLVSMKPKKNPYSSSSSSSSSDSD